MKDLNGVDLLVGDVVEILTIEGSFRPYVIESRVVDVVYFKSTRTEKLYNLQIPANKILTEVRFLERGR